jgi:hydroxymethylbilane synthase
MKRLIRLGSRDSRLAVAQAEIFMASLREKEPGIECELVTMKTQGDRILERSLAEIGGKGLFVAELDRALLDGEIDLSVSSLKDLPSALHPDLPIAWHSPRACPFDAIVLPEGREEPDMALPVGSSSVRRTAQLSALWPWAKYAPMRGNVQTRLEKLERGGFSATLLAAAGLERLGLQKRAWRVLSAAEMLPSAGQGVIVCQARPDLDTAFLASSEDPVSKETSRAERAFVEAMGADCASPIAAFAETMKGGGLALSGMIAERGEVIRAHIFGKAGEGRDMGARLADILRAEEEGRRGA